MSTSTNAREIDRAKKQIHTWENAFGSTDRRVAKAAADGLAEAINTCLEIIASDDSRANNTDSDVAVNLIRVAARKLVQRMVVLLTHGNPTDADLFLVYRSTAAFFKRKVVVKGVDRNREHEIRTKVTALVHRFGPVRDIEVPQRSGVRKKIFVKSFRHCWTGQRIHAEDYGHTAFCFEVDG